MDIKKVFDVVLKRIGILGASCKELCFIYLVIFLFITLCLPVHQIFTNLSFHFFFFAVTNFDIKIMRAFFAKKKKKDESSSSGANVIIVALPPLPNLLKVLAKKPTKTRETEVGQVLIGKRFNTD